MNDRVPPGTPANDPRLDGWPNREASRFVSSGGMTWHVQAMGAGPLLLLLHGTGAATHSWRDLAPLLAADFTVVAPDMPGHGFTTTPPRSRLSLPGMAKSVALLLDTMGVRPVLAAGHSAGAAVLLRMCFDGRIAPRGIVALNGAMLPMQGLAGQVFSPLARALTGVPLLPNIFALTARDGTRVQRLLANTGSRIGPEGERLYARLLRDPKHAGAALGMMAQWDLRSVEANLPRLETPLLLLAGANDRAVPPAQSERVRGMAPHATLTLQPGLGHLAHEEDPAGTAGLIRDFARTVGALA